MAIGGDINYPGPGWYLHLLFVQGKIRLYVGQTTSLRRRIVRQHCSEAYRSGNPSLHYKAWEQAEWDAWVVLGCGQITHHITEAQKLYLNVGEMWCGLLFRCLLKRQLEKYLPPFAIGMLGPDQHLNIGPARPRHRAREWYPWAGALAGPAAPRIPIGSRPKRRKSAHF